MYIIIKKHKTKTLQRQKQNLHDGGSAPGLHLGSPVEDPARAQAGQGLQKEVIKTHANNCEIEA
jgi:hypothetical protein